MALLIQASSVANGELPNIDVFVNLTIAHEAFVPDAAPSERARENIFAL